MGASDKVSTIGGLVIAAGIGVAVATGTPIASADNGADSTSSEGADSSKESTGTDPGEGGGKQDPDDEVKDAEEQAGDDEESEEGEEGDEPEEIDEPLGGDEPTDEGDEGDEIEPPLPPETEPPSDPAEPAPPTPDPVVDVVEQASESATQRTLRVVETEQVATESVFTTQSDPTAVTALPPSARLGLVTPLAGVLQAFTNQVPVSLRAAAVPTVNVAPPQALPTPPRLATGLLSLVGFSPTTGLRPGAPVLPSLPRLLEFVFVAIRQYHQYVWHNTPPTVTTEIVSEDVATGATVYNFVLDDADDDRLVLKVGQPKYGNLTENADGTYLYTPNEQMATAGYTDEFTVTVSDDTRLFGLPLFNRRHTDTEKVTVVVDPNKAPTLDVSVIEGPDEDTGETVYEVTVGDPNNDTVTYTVFDDVDHGTLTHDPATDTYTYTPSPTYAHAVAAGTEDGEDAFIVRATDEHGAYTDYLVNITVAPQNDVPVITISQVGTNEYAITVDDDDDDPAPVIAGPTHGTLTYNAGTGTYVYTPDYDYAHAVLHGGPDTDVFTVTVNDGHGGTDTASQTITVAPENKAPTVELSAGPVDQTTGQVVLTVVGGDPDADDGTPTYTWDVTGGSVVANPNGNGTYVFTPSDPHAAGVATIKVVATDTHGGVGDDQVQVSIPARQSAPEINLVKESVNGTTGAVTYNPNYVDAEGDTPTYTFSDPANGSVAVVNGKIVYTPDYAYAHSLALNGSTAPGSDQFTVTVDDGFGGSDTQIVDVEVTPLNREPVIYIQISQSPGQAIQQIVLLQAVDEDGDTISLNDSFAVESGGRILVSPGNTQHLLSGVPISILLDASGGGSAQYSVTVRDEYGGSTTFVFVQSAPTPVNS